VDAATGAMATRYGEHEAELVVAGRREVAEGVVSLTLADPAGADLPEWTPGAHVDLVLSGTVTRQYSLCGTPSDRAVYRIAVLLDEAGRGGSRLVHEKLDAGARVLVRGPRNHFPLVAASSYTFLAGGIGITPVLPMIAAAEARGVPWRLHYGGRQLASMAFVDEVADYGDRVELWPQDERGLLDLDTILDAPEPHGLVYACGPEGLLTAVEKRCGGELHVERFAARPVEAGAAEGFEVVLQRSGITLTVPPDRSILEVVEEAGVSALSSCQEGVCGTCETAVLEGLPDHRDSLLTEEDEDYVMICVSRSRSPRLVLDL
jgi:ferredoxin-NADP reductase